MKISTVLDHIDSGHIALPEFQRGYVWNRDQVKGLFDSLYRRHPVGGLLVWVTESQIATHRGDRQLAPGMVKLLLDGQQRITSLYGVLRGMPPEFFDGNVNAFTGLYFNLEKEVFSFYMATIMKDDPLWLSVTELMKEGNTGLGKVVDRLSKNPDLAGNISEYIGRISRLLSISDIDLHVEEVTGKEKSIDVVVDIFNRVNSGGTKLSKGDLALAKICSDWPEAREIMKNKLSEWKKDGYEFNLDWLLRSINTVLTGEAKFLFLHNKSVDEIKDGLKRASRSIETILNHIGGRLGLDHDRVLFGKYAIPVMVNYLDNKNGSLTDKERDKLLFWYVQAGMWGRYSGSTESYIDKDLSAFEKEGNKLDNLVEQMRLWHGGLRVEAGHFTGWSLGARLYPVLYMLTRMGSALDWGSGLPLKANLLGKMNKLEVHHIFPKAQLYNMKYNKAEVNAIANFCFLTKNTNLNIRDRRPEEYFREIEKIHPGALASQWIPMDPELWKLENYGKFLEARKQLLAEATNKLMEELLHGESQWLSGPVVMQKPQLMNVGIESDEEEEVLRNLNEWVMNNGLTPGAISHEFIDPVKGDQYAIFDIAWPNGLQENLSEPVAVLLNEGAEILSFANKTGYRCFTSVDSFKEYVMTEILKEEEFEQLRIEQS